MKKANSSKFVRRIKTVLTELNIEALFGSEGLKRLKEIQAKTDAEEVSEVIENIFQFYDSAFQEIEEGNKLTLVVTTPSDEVIEYDLFADD